MEVVKYTGGDDSTRCTISTNYDDCGESGMHQKTLYIKLNEMELHYSGIMKRPIVVHDEEWDKRTEAHFCHFCLSSHLEHHRENGLVIENLGCVYHHADSHHLTSVKSFLSRNSRLEKPERYYASKTNLDSFLAKLPAAKKSYFKEMEKLNDLAQPSCSYAVESPPYDTDPMGNEQCNCELKDPLIEEISGLENLVLDDSPSVGSVLKDNGLDLSVLRDTALHMTTALENLDFENLDLDNPVCRDILKRVKEKIFHGSS